MISSVAPENEESRDLTNCTIASTFIKAKSVRFDLLFGNYVKKQVRDDTAGEIRDVVDYFFEPGEVFGFCVKSLGGGHKKFQQAFVLRALEPGEFGREVTGVLPGAEILLETDGTTSTLRLKEVLSKLQNNKVDLAHVSAKDYRRLHKLLDAKLNTDFFVGELVGMANGY